MYALDHRSIGQKPFFLTVTKKTGLSPQDSHARPSSLWPCHYVGGDLDGEHVGGDLDGEHTWFGLSSVTGNFGGRRQCGSQLEHVMVAEAGELPVPAFLGRE